MSRIRQIKSQARYSLDKLSLFTENLLAEAGMPCIPVTQTSNSLTTRNDYERLPYIVRVHRVAWSPGLLRRRPELTKGDRFTSLETELFIKLNHRGQPVYSRATQLRLIKRQGNATLWYRVDRPLKAQKQNSWVMEIHEVSALEERLREQANHLFALLEQGWAEIGQELYSLSLEFALDVTNTLCPLSNMNLVINQQATASPVAEWVM